MSEFFLDLRLPAHRTPAVAERNLRWFSDTWVETFDFEPFALALSRCDDREHWGPYRAAETGLVVALAGRVAWEEAVWKEAASLPGGGGLAARLIGCRYAEDRPLDDLLNGAFTVIICDPSAGRVVVVTDRCGMCPVFHADVGGHVLSSHPDLVAAATRGSTRLDRISVAEFLMSGRVSYPFTYYEHVRGLDMGSIYVCRPEALAWPEKQRTYFKLNYRPEPDENERDLAAQLGDAFRRAVQRRTLPRFGRTGISLSGGLDSRTLLCCRDRASDAVAFTFFDEENYESRIAGRIAQAEGVSLVPLPRAFDHYGQAAAEGVRLQGGMGSFVNNHFLGFRAAIRNLGATNVLAGFYCDYLFKGLGLDKAVRKLSGLDRLQPFSLAWYRPRFAWPTQLARDAEERHMALFADITARDSSDLGRLKTEGRRLFPLAYEPDNAETVITQRALPWYLPIVDTEIVDVYQRISPRLKLDCRLFAAMVVRECGPTVASIPDANTGLPVGRLGAAYAARHAVAAVGRRVRRLCRPRMATEGSWPNWAYYAHHSELLRNVWSERPMSDEDVVAQVMGADPFSRDIRSFGGDDIELLMRLLTLRLWLRHRVS